MITVTQLESMWFELSYSGTSEFEFKRIDNISIPELNIGLNSKTCRCLILELPTGIPGSWPSLHKENLSFSWYSDTGYIVIELLDVGYIDLFNDLIVSIYRQVYDLLNPDDYISSFIRVFNKWSGFFDTRQVGRMQLESLRGLLGELVVLREMIKPATPHSINEILASWRGPFDQVRDFIPVSQDTEVKTTDGNSDIRISSEFQLQPDLGKELYLVVVILESDLTGGFSLRDLVNEIRELTDSLLGDPSLLPDALFEKGLTFRNVHEYDNFRFRVRKIIRYDCLLPNFPTLSSSALPQGVYKVTYSLRMSLLNNFIIQVTEF